LIRFISLDISIKLLLPERGIRRGPLAARILVTVPEAAVNEYGHSVFRQQNVGRPASFGPGLMSVYSAL
jgi:hypothetical protein